MLSTAHCSLALNRGLRRSTWQVRELLSPPEDRVEGVCGCLIAEMSTTAWVGWRCWSRVSVSSGCLAAQIQRHTESTRLPGPLAGVSAPHTRRLIPWVPRKCMTDVGSLALSSPAETCAGVWGLVLRVWVPAHSPNSGEAAPEARPAGGALRPRLIGECTASREASLLGGRGGSKSPSS